MFKNCIKEGDYLLVGDLVRKSDKEYCSFGIVTGIRSYESFGKNYIALEVSHVVTFRYEGTENLRFTYKSYKEAISNQESSWNLIPHETGKEWRLKLWDIYVDLDTDPSYKSRVIEVMDRQRELGEYEMPLIGNKWYKEENSSIKNDVIKTINKW